MLRYTGAGAFVPNVPARDLSQADLDALDARGPAPNQHDSDVPDWQSYLLVQHPDCYEEAST